MTVMIYILYFLPIFCQLSSHSGQTCVCLVIADNLFVDSLGELLKIGDFGNAQYMVDGVVDNFMEGTVHFMAPEVSILPLFSLFILVSTDQDVPKS